MFLDYYGLRENPFGVIADTRFLYLSPSHYNALDALYHGLNNGQEFLALVAPPGMGKTTVLRRLASQLAVRVIFLSLTNSGTRELIGCLLGSLGVDSTDRDLLWMHERLNDVLRNEARSSHRFVLILDEAQNLTSSTLETLRLLSNFETPNDKLIQTVLVGQSALADALARPEHEQLRQRLSILARLEPLSPSDVAKYIEFRLRVAGYAGQPLFTSRACRMIAGWSRGIPRRINSLCFNAMSLGSAADKRRIDGRVVRRAIAALDLDKLTSEARGAQIADFAAGFDRTPWFAVASILLLIIILAGSFSYLRGFGRWFPAGATSNVTPDVAERFPAPSTAPEPPNSPRSGREFVELPRVVPPSIVSLNEFGEEAAPRSLPGKVNLPKSGTEAVVPNESPKTVVAAATGSSGSSAGGASAVGDDKILTEVKLGENYMRQGEYDDALREFQSALAQDPANRDLRGKVETARRAKATEARILE